MDTYKYEVLLKVVEAGTLTQAAETLGYTQPGLSHILNSLESDFGIKILRRDRNGVHLTSEGMQILPYIQDICQKEQIFRRNLEEIKRVNSHVIRIGAMISVSTHVLPELVYTFRKTHPHIVFQLSSGSYGDIEKWVVEKKVDIGFLPEPITAPLKTFSLRDDQIYVVMPHGHPLEKFRAVPQKELLRYPFIVHESICPQDFSNVDVYEDIKRGARYIANDDHSLLALVEKNMAIALVSDLILRRTPYNVVRRKLDPAAHRKIVMAINPKGNKTVVISEFLNLVIKSKDAEYLWR